MGDKPETEILEAWAEDREARMAWWREARLGMFVHWGLYSVAAGSWEGRDYEQPYAEWIQHWAGISSRKYARTLRPGFTASRYDPGAWADLARRAHMKYAVMTTRHHDGFTLFNSDHPWAVKNDVSGGTNISPPGRDLISEFVEAFRSRDMKTGFFYSFMDWQHPHAPERYLPEGTTGKHRRDREQYLAYLHHQVDELMTRYGKVDIFWPDFSRSEREGKGWEEGHLLRLLRENQPHIIVNNRLWDGEENPHGDYATPEKYIPMEGVPGVRYWEVSHTLNESYGYSHHDQNWKSPTEVIRILGDTVARGGNLLLNVGPDAEGAIPEPAVKMLESLGDWLDKNGGAVFGTEIGFEGLPFDGACTVTKGEGLHTHLNVMLYTIPEEGAILLPGMKNRLEEAVLLSTGQKLDSTRTDDGIEIGLSGVPEDALVPVVRVTVEGEPEVEE